MVIDDMKLSYSGTVYGCMKSVYVFVLVYTRTPEPIQVPLKSRRSVSVKFLTNLYHKETKLRESRTITNLLR